MAGARDCSDAASPVLQDGQDGMGHCGITQQPSACLPLHKRRAVLTATIAVATCGTLVSTAAAAAGLFAHRLGGEPGISMPSHGGLAIRRRLSFATSGPSARPDPNATVVASHASNAWVCGAGGPAAWPGVKRDCGACNVVTSAGYGFSCNTYCHSLGLQCSGAWEATDGSCHPKRAWNFLLPIDTHDAICRCEPRNSGHPVCSVLGSPHRGDCRTTLCCAHPTDRCFEKDAGWAGCRSTCLPGQADPEDAPQYRSPWTCRLPFEDPRAQAPASYKWPHTVAVCSSDSALVEFAAWHVKYGGSCDTFCRLGAGKAVDPDLSQLWYSRSDRSSSCSNELTSCPGTQHWRDSPRGVLCACSFPDRRI